MIALFYGIQDIDAILASPVPNATLFLQATGGNLGSTYVLMLVIYLPLLTANLDMQVTASRMLWSFSRDKGVPGHRWISRINSRLGVPLNAHIVVLVIMVLLGFLYLFSASAFNALVGSSFVLGNISYLFPLTTNFLRKRKGITVPGPYFMKGITGFIINGLAIIWLMFTIVIFNLPFFMPVIPQDDGLGDGLTIGGLENMNWTCVVCGGIIVLALVWYAVDARKTFSIPDASLSPHVIDSVDGSGSPNGSYTAPATPVAEKSK